MISEIHIQEKNTLEERTREGLRTIERPSSRGKVDISIDARKCLGGIISARLNSPLYEGIVDDVRDELHKLGGLDQNL